MSKHFSIFATEAQYLSVQDTLDYPNVSLIDTTGDLHYATYTGKEVADAPFGSILMATVANNKLFYIDNSEYNLTDFPFADYKPIAVCIYDKASNANNQAVFMSVQWADYTDLGTPKASAKGMTWGFHNVNLSSQVTEIRDRETNHISSISINNAVKTLITKDYSGSSITDTSGDGESTAFCSAWRFKTVGTREGDWYLPSYYDSTKYKNNYSSINNILTNIKNIAGSAYLNTVTSHQYTSTESTNTAAWFLRTNGSFADIYTKNSSNTGVRPVFIAGVQEL